MTTVVGRVNVGGFVDESDEDAEMSLEKLEGRRKGGHFIESVLEEIALEGLDGITFQGLKVRLEQRGDLEVENFEVIAPSVWSQLKRCKNVGFYMLSKSRPDLQGYRWSDYKDERGTYYEPLYAPEEIYHYNPVEDKASGIRGSCQDYSFRKEITNVARQSSYVQIMQGLGNRFVIVASQPFREQALLGPNYKIYKGLSIVQYCIVERVGRARSAGEVTRGKISSSCLNIPPKTLFYMRKHLIKTGLILKQSVSIKFGSGKCPAGVTVFHLPRFFQKIESVGSINTRIIFTWLNTSLTKSVPVEKIVSRFGKHTLRAVTHDFRPLVGTQWEERSGGAGGALEGDPLEDDPAPTKKKNVRVLYLKEVDVDLQNRALVKAFNDQQASGEEEDGGAAGGDPQEDDLAVNISSPSSYTEVQVLRPNKQLLFESTCVQILFGMMRAGVGGLTLFDIRNLVNMTPLESRSCSRFLTRHKFASESMIKLHKQKAFTYSLVCFQGGGLEGDLGMQEKLMVAVQRKERIQGILEKREEKARARRIKALKQKQKRIRDVKPVVSEPEQVEDDPPPPPEDPLPILEAPKKKIVTKYPREPNLVPVSVEDPPPPPIQEATAPPPIETDFEGPPEEPLESPPPAQENMDESLIDEGAPSPENGDYDDIDLTDPVDQLVRKNLTRQRVAWSPIEDRYVLVSFIASALFIPKYPFDRLFMYNAGQIRNLLWDKSGGKSDKTSGAIRRRLHFLLRQKRPHEWYMQHLGSALRDYSLYEKYINEVLPPPQVRIYWTPPDDRLTQVVDYLMDKFGSDGGVVCEPSGVVQQEDTKTCSGLDTLLFLRQLKRAEPYWNGVMFVMCLKMGATQQERTQFRRAWRDKYGQEGSSMKEDMFTDYCWRFLRFLVKNLTITFNNIIALAYLSSKLFQVVHFKSVMASASTSNLFLSRRECSGQAEVKLWTARSVLLEQFFSGGIEASKLNFLSELPMEKGAQLLQRSRILVSVKESRLLRLNKKVIKNFVAGLPLGAFGEIWELMCYLEEKSRVDALACHSVGLVMAVIETTDYWSSRLTLPRMLFKLKKNLGGGEEPSQDGQEEGRSKRPRLSSEGESSANKKRKKRRKSDDKVVTKVAQSLSSLSVSDDKPEEMMSPDLGKETKSNSGIPERVGLDAGENFKSSRTDHNAMQLLRVRLNPSALSAFEEDEEAVSINFPTLELQFAKTMNEMNKSCVGTKEPFSMERLKELRKALIELAYHRVAYPDGGSDPTETIHKFPGLPKYLNKYTPLFDIINMTGSVGVSGAYLKTVFDKNYLVGGLKHLLECKLIFSLGVTTRRFVAFTNANNWLIPIRSPLDNAKVVGNVVMRPWVTTVGGISWSTINRLFAALVGQLQKPAILLTELCQLFEPVLSHVESLVLIEALTKLKYLILYKLEEPRATLFSKPLKDKSRIEYHPDTILDTDNVYVAASPYVALLHSQLNHSIQRHCKKKPTYAQAS